MNRYDPDIKDELLLEKAKTGDADAFGRLVERYERLCYNAAYRLMGNYDDALDISQEALIKAYKNIHKCGGITHFRNWLYTIINNCCIDELRKRKNKTALSLDEDIEAEDGSVGQQYPSGERTPEQALIQSELRQELQNAISKLSHEHKAMIVLSDIRGLSYEEVAEITQTNVGTVKSRLSRARARLKEILLKKAEHSPIYNVSKPKDKIRPERR